MNKKRNSFIVEYQYIVMAFLATAVTMLAVYLCNGMVPFGDKTILRMDLYHQYGPLFAELYDKIKEGGSLFYSWSSGLGSSFLGNYFNYLSSPVGAIIMFFGHKNIPEAIGAMILIKAALSASTFTFYVKNSLKRQSYAVVSFGVLYAFCGYMLAYYWNVMWLDAMVLLPVVLLGIERIINNGKPATYITGLALTMFSNYYMSYMLCIFSVIYFIYYFSANYSLSDVVSKKFTSEKRSTVRNLSNNRFIRTGFIFAFASLAAAGLMAAVLLPVYGVLKSSSATSGTFPSDFESYFSFFDFFANHFANLTTTIRSSGDDVLPNVYCGILTIILAPLYFFTKSISKKEKICTLILLITLYFTFNINIFNYIWHGFHFPNDLPYRQSFIYSFILLIMAYKVFLRLKEFNSRQIGTVGVALVAFVFFVEKITSKNVGTGSVLLTLALAVLYVVVLTIFLDKRYHAASLAFLLLICVCSEVVMCDSSTVSITITKDSYASDYDEFKKLKNNLDIIEQDEFYRMELTDLRTRMDPSWYGYNGVSVFSSMASESLSNLQDDLGMMSNRINSYTYNPQTPVYNMMFSLKYIVNNESFNVLNSPYYTPSVSSEGFSAYKNNYYLPIAYCISSNAETWATEEYMNAWKIDHNSDPFQLQGDYFDLATGAGNPFEKLDISYATYSNISPFSESLSGTSFSYFKTTPDADGSVILYLTPEKEGNVYIYFDVTGSNDKSITINSSIGTKSHNIGQNSILDLGRYKENESITVTIPFDSNSGKLSFFAYTINDEILNNGYKILSDNQMITEKHNDTYISGRFTANKDCILYTSIPYDEGWKVIIDGKEVEKENIISLGNGLIAVKVEKGNHDVEFKFSASYLRAGIIISAFTFAVLILLYFLRKLKSVRNKVKHSGGFEDLNCNYSEEIFIPVKCEAVPEAENNKITAVAATPVKEIIYPTQRYIKREIIEPSVSIETEDISL